MTDRELLQEMGQRVAALEYFKRSPEQEGPMGFFSMTCAQKDFLLSICPVEYGVECRSTPYHFAGEERGRLGMWSVTFCKKC